MTKKLINIIALALAFASCSKNTIDSPTTEPAEGGTLTITASIGEPQTKLSYTEQTDGSYMAKFSSSDQIKLFFVKSDNTVANSQVASVDSYTITPDGRSAKFNLKYMTLPSDASKIVAYLTNTSSALAFNDTLGTVSLATQKDLATAQKNHILVSSINVSDLKSTDPGKYVADMKFAYKTNLLRFNLTFPVMPSASTLLTLSSPSGKIHNSVAVVYADLDASKSAFGDISFYPESVDTTKKSIVGTICSLAGDDLSDAMIRATIDGETYGGSLNLSKTTLDAGKVYDVTRTLGTLPKPGEIWTDDAAGTATFTSSGNENVTNDWLSCNGTTISWTANTTGKPRTARLNFKNGASYSVTQIGVADFKGDWTFTSKTFAGAVSPVHKSTDPLVLSVKIADPLNPATLVDATGTEHTNNLGIKGIYGETTLDACLDINYEERTVRVGLFLDTRDGIGQQVSSGYMTYFPGLCTITSTAWGQPWKYYETEQGNPDYSWLWLTVSDDYNTLVYKNRTTSEVQFQVLGQYASSMNAICGFGVVVSNTNVFNAETVAAYSNFFQCNPSGKAGLSFDRQ